LNRYAGGLNLYAYVGGDPVNYTDPWGLSRIFSCTRVEGTDANGLPTIGTSCVGGGGGPGLGVSFPGLGASPSLPIGFGGGGGQGAGILERLENTVSDGFEQNKKNIKDSVCRGLLPSLPGGALAEIVKNIKEAIDIKNILSKFAESSLLNQLSSFLTENIGFALEVRTGGNLDLKNQERFLGSNGQTTRPGRNAGNFNYGATGTALGFGRFRLTIGAHGYSLLANRTIEGQMNIIRAGIAFTEIGCFE